MPSVEVIVLGADHNGVTFKAKAKALLKEAGYRCVDLGPYATTPSVDYVDYAKQLGTMIGNGDGDRGILVCGTGVGMSIASNKIDGVRAALVHNMESARKSREHNDANVLCLGTWINDDETNLEILMTWLHERFGEYRHVKRVEKLQHHPAEQIVLTNGVFDILHAGQIECLRFAKSLGGRLVVAINSDRTASRIKGPGRPVTSEGDRKAVLQSIKYVDEVVIFDDLKPTSLIRELSPHVVVKGGEFTADEIRARDEIPPEIAVKVFPFVPGFSASSIIKTIRNE
ncbi:MAG: RpiB/LacA/LacB family sugar-phosphate isomerase [Myxococcales bacterium]|nr:RpiB/LacA/LacB family sugar-phosphate isomerase [Myxococcales bacterium]